MPTPRAPPRASCRPPDRPNLTAQIGRHGPAASPGTCHEEGDWHLPKASAETFSSFDLRLSRANARALARFITFFRKKKSERSLSAFVVVRPLDNPHALLFKSKWPLALCTNLDGWKSLGESEISHRLSCSSLDVADSRRVWATVSPPTLAEACPMLRTPTRVRALSLSSEANA